MLATIGSCQRDLRDLSIAYQDRLRQFEAAKEQEHSAQVHRTQLAERAVRAARALHEEERRQWSSELAEASERVSSERFHVQRLEADIERLREERRRWQAEATELEAARVQIRALREERSSLQEQLAVWEALGRDPSSLREERSQLLQRLAQREGEFQQVRWQLQALTGERDTASAEVKQLQAKLSQLQAELSEAQEELNAQHEAPPAPQLPLPQPMHSVADGWASSFDTGWGMPQVQGQEMYGMDAYAYPTQPMSFMAETMGTESHFEVPPPFGVPVEEQPSSPGKKSKRSSKKREKRAAEGGGLSPHFGGISADGPTPTMTLEEFLSTRGEAAEAFPRRPPVSPERSPQPLPEASWPQAFF